MHRFQTLLQQHPLIFFHLVSAVSALPLGVGYGRRGNVRGHCKTMQGQYIGTRIIAGLFTLMLGRFLGSAVFGTPTTGIAG